MKTVVVLVNIIGIDFVKLLQAVDLRRVQAKEELFLCAPPVALLFAFFRPIPGTGMDNNNAKRSADERQLLIGIRRTVIQLIPISE